MRPYFAGLLAALSLLLVLHHSDSALAFSGGVTVSAADKESDQGRDAERRNDFPAAKRLYEKACFDGSSIGCFNAGVFNETGKGAPVDMERAAISYRRACEVGNIAGCDRAGVFYDIGKGVTPDPSLAREFYLRACNGGIATGCYNLGLQYLKVPASSDQDAARYFGIACERGLAKGCDRMQKLRPSQELSPAQSATVNVQRAVPLWALSIGERMTPGSLQLSMDLQTGHWVGTYKFSVDDGPVKTKTFEAQRIGTTLCLMERYAIAKYCGEAPATEAEANRLYAIAASKRAGQRAVVADVEHRDRGQTPGALLSAADQDCMKTFSENYQEYVEGECTSGYYTQITGNHICTSHSGGMVTRTRNFEKNICNRPIRFRDQCGSTIWGSYSIQPGARFDRKFSYPCERIY